VTALLLILIVLFTLGVLCGNVNLAFKTGVGYTC